MKGQIDQHGKNIRHDKKNYESGLFCLVTIYMRVIYEI